MVTKVKASSIDLPSLASAGLGGGSVTAYTTLAELPLSGNSAGDQALVLENNRLYIWNGSGWYNIALINTSPSITGGYSSSYRFTTDGTPIEITLVGSDPEGIPLTWSYEVTAGSLTNGGGTTATVSQTDNVFTITPTTTQAYAGVFSITWKASDGVNLGTAVSSFTLAFEIVNSKYTSLLVKGLASGNNATFVDSSTNNFAITKNGDVTQGTFGPYNTNGYSTYFPGSAYFTSGLTNSIGSGEFTVEVWIKPTVATYNTITNSGVNGFLIRNDGGTSILFNINNTNVITASSVITPNVWNHIAICRDSLHQITLYVNGTSVATGSSAANIPTTFTIADANWPSESFVGQMTDFRFSDIARYSSNFVPEKIAGTDANTLILALTSPYITDLAGNSLTASTTGFINSPEVPFDHQAYDPAVNGGSAYFDGTGDVLVLPANDAFAFGTGPFCIEAWIYNNVLKNYSCLVTTRPDNGSYADAYHIGWDANGGVSLYVNTTSSPGGANGTMKTNVWQHFVCCRDSNNITSIFVDGVRVGTATITSNFTRNLLGIGDFPTTQAENINGYISNLRLVKGNSVYDPTQTTITPPTAPLTAITNTNLLLNCTNADIIDNSSKNNLTLIGNTSASATQTKYAARSVYFDGTGDYITVPFNGSNQLGTADFTIELWAYIIAQGSLGTSLVNNYTTWTTGAIGLFAGHASADLTKYHISYNGSGFPSLSSTTSIITNQWHHLAVVRSSGTITLYINGTSEGSFSGTASLNGIGNWTVGTAGDGTASYTLNGYIEDLRITKGLARYTANFTPPTLELLG